MTSATAVPSFGYESLSGEVDIRSSLRSWMTLGGLVGVRSAAWGGISASSTSSRGSSGLCTELADESTLPLERAHVRAEAAGDAGARRPAGKAIGPAADRSRRGRAARSHADRRERVYFCGSISAAGEPSVGGCCTGHAVGCGDAAGGRAGGGVEVVL
jgi:hypothetical protein